MTTGKEYISELLKCDVYDSEALLSLRENFLNPQATQIVEVSNYDEVESQVLELSENFWDSTESEFSEKSKEISEDVQAFAELKKHFDKLNKLNSLRTEVNKLSNDKSLNQVFIQDLKKVLVLRGQSLRALELKVFENIKNSNHQNSVVRTVRHIQQNLKPIAKMHEDWFLKLQRIKTAMKLEEKVEKPSHDWVWIALGIFFLIKGLMNFLK